MLLEGRSRNINARRRVAHVLISNNLLVRKSYFDSNIIQNENARILRHFSMDYFEADVDRSTFTCDVIKARKLNTLTLAT